MTIGDIKKALVELSDFCSRSISCNICPFAELTEDGEVNECMVSKIPCRWQVEQWRECDK